MKKSIYTITFIAAIFTTLSTNIYASTPPSEKHEFKSTEREVNFEIERKAGEVTLYIQSAFLNTYDQIIIERMGEVKAGYSACKTLDVAKMKIDGDYIVAADRYPLPAQTAVSYRVRTIAKDGTNKTFPPVALTLGDIK
ncbi:MAG: hypothetical protein JSS76_13850 [Bacteroidetes bacterium]|nr:hypothetical protein [Bacteroidota bacterium]MBS1685827.1 hypothetical protein [Bacteroidota bacterium]